ncbi:Protein arginine methyltransferase NDUFAF7, mitochondrial [Clarias magur]|uniref:Protein arginine methyltransferase NDUFAF7, mitochondrial n=1 Tax=Clarias magur TaxID=1594786 RepID=A0A8J4X6H0_CLAMG|nr:Protein arginine methyltransferase NDUFAF7, mitochondrial [Clarias magur]
MNGYECKAERIHNTRTRQHDSSHSAGLIMPLDYFQMKDEEVRCNPVRKKMERSTEEICRSCSLVAPPKQHTPSVCVSRATCCSFQ